MIIYRLGVLRTEKKSYNQSTLYLGNTSVINSQIVK